MVAVTYDVGRVAATDAPKVAKATPRKSLFTRFMNALVEARMAQARREISLHLGMLPYTLDERGNRLVKTGSHEMPFGGW